jgi:hypothetical protein
MARGRLPREKSASLGPPLFTSPSHILPLRKLTHRRRVLSTLLHITVRHRKTQPSGPRPLSGRVFRVTRFRQPQQTHINSIVVGVIDLLGANADVQKVLELAAVVFHVLSNAIDQPTLRCFFDVQRFSVNGIDCGFRG